MARSLLLGALQRLLRDREEPNSTQPTRRQFLLSAAAAAPVVFAPPLRGATAPKVAVVGGGIAGLNAALTLKESGIIAPIYEASSRSGGRMFSMKGVAAPEVTTELGGEFIDTGHVEMLSLAKRFGLPLIDTGAESEASLIPEAFLFGGSVRKPREIADEFRPMIDRMKADVRAAQGRAWKRFDALSIDQYLDEVGARGWARALLDVAYRTEYGLDTGDQSAMNLLCLVEPHLHGERIHLFGESDERYKILGGNQRVADAVASEVRDQIQLEHRLVSVRQQGSGFLLTFQTAGGTKEVTADVVILTIPFTVLRNVELRIPLTNSKLRAIRELGYGTNSKLFFGFSKRLWRDQGYAGALFTDTDCQLVWDSSRLQSGDAGALTMLMGGKAGVAIGQGEVAEHETRLMPEVERVWSGVSAIRTQVGKRIH
jgi:monoamine oxidase